MKKVVYNGLPFSISHTHILLLSYHRCVKRVIILEVLIVLDELMHLVNSMSLTFGRYNNTLPATSTSSFYKLILNELIKLVYLVYKHLL